MTLILDIPGFLLPLSLIIYYVEPGRNTVWGIFDCIMLLSYLLFLFFDVVLKGIEGKILKGNIKWHNYLNEWICYEGVVQSKLWLFKAYQTLKKKSFM